MSSRRDPVGSFRLGFRLGPGSDDPQWLRGFQSDFGGYDSRFAGVTIRLATPHAWLLTFGSDDEEAMRALTSAEKEGPGSLFEKLALLTVRPHEVRHVHDALIAPFGSKVFWARFFSTFYGGQLVGLLPLAEPENPDFIVPVPITKWLDADEAQRALWLHRWCRHAGRELRVVDLLGVADEPDVAKLLERARTRNAALRALFLDDGGSQSRLMSLHISEASALVVQAATVMVRFGDRRAEHFVNSLVYRTSSPYSSALTRLIALSRWGRAESVDLPALAAIVTWSLLGKEESAVTRFAYLAKLLSERGVPAGTAIDKAGEVFDEWDARLNMPSTLEGVAEALSGDERQLALVQQALDGAEDGPGRVWLEALVPAAEMWLAARRQMTGRFLADPGLYCDPIAYLHTEIDDYVEPPILYLPDGAYVSEESFKTIGLAGAGYKVLDRTFGDETVVTAFGAPQAPAPVMDLQTAYEVSRHHVVSDYLFGAFRRDVGEYEQALGRAALGGAQAVEILD